MGLRQWIRDGERYKIMFHEPPLIGSATGTLYPYSICMKNPRLGWMFWFQVHYAESYDMAVRSIDRDKARPLMTFFFERQSVEIKRPVIETQPDKTPIIDDIPEIKKPYEYEYRAIRIDPPGRAYSEAEYPIEVQFKIKGPYGTWMPFTSCKSEEEIDDAIAECKTMINRWKNKTETVIKQVD